MNNLTTTNGALPYRLPERPNLNRRAGRAWTPEEHAELTALVFEYYNEPAGLRPIQVGTYEAWGEKMGRSAAALSYKASQLELTYTNFETVPPLATKTEPANPKPPEVANIGSKTVLDLPDEWLEQADRLAEDLNRDGKYLAFGRMTRTTVLRLAVQRGLRNIEAHCHA